MAAKRAIIPIFVPHLGCPNDCVFCNQRRISGTTEPATGETVARIVDNALANIKSRECEIAFYGGSFTAIEEQKQGELRRSYTAEPTMREIAFYGGSFTAIETTKQVELLSAANVYIKNGSVSRIRVSTRPDAIDSDTVSRLKRYNVETVELGCQSMVGDVLRLSKRGHTADDCRTAIRLLKSEGFTVIAQMMTGLLGDSGEQSLFTARELAALKPDGVRIYPTVVVSDTELYDMWKSGAYKEHTVEEAVKLGADILQIFEDAGIPVIRFGLNPTDDLSGGDAVAGAYHPALGELVRSELYLRRARELLKAADTRKEITIIVPKGAVSAMVGQKRHNIETLKAEFGVKSIKVTEGTTDNGKISLK